MQRSKWLRIVILCAGFGLIEPRLAHSSDELSELGERLSKTHCARCHVVDDKDPFSGISSTPSFSLMVNGLDDWNDRFLSFHTRLPHPSVVRFKGDPVDPDATFATVPMILEYSDIDAIAAYAQSLKKTN